MDNVAYFQSLIAYHHAQFARIWESVMMLDEARFTEPVNYSHGSLCNQLVHVAAVDGRWLRAMQEDPAARQWQLLPTNYHERTAARTAWQSVVNDWRAYIATLDADALAAPPNGLPGPRWQIIAHVVNHGTDHRAQILRVLHDFGAPTFEQDLLYHYWPG